MSQPLEDVRMLAGEIGPRGTGTPAEAAGADYVARRLAHLGLPVEQHHFRAVASQNSFPLAIDVLVLLAVAIYPLAGAPTRWIAAALAMCAAPLLWQTIRNAGNPLSIFLPKVTSRNVETRVSPKSETRKRAVILAHLDTNRCRLAWQSKRVASIEPLTWLVLGVLASPGLIFLAGALLGGPSWLWWLSLLPAACVMGMMVTLWKDDHTPWSPGAHDNAASVAVALEVAARLARRPLATTEVWLIFDGAEETDHGGVRDLLRRHASLLRQAAFFGLEGLGSGEIVYLTRQGICAPYHPAPHLRALAERVATGHPQLDFRPAEMLAEDDVRTLRERGYHAIGIAGRDPHTGILPYWHRPDDTVATVSTETMERAAEIVLALLDELDKA
ncbi:MAG: M28 family peptidase [Chloroflexi bacterium]|nr:M28 family peptidase [Chloroflexota bacterium]